MSAGTTAASVPSEREAAAGTLARQFVALTLLSLRRALRSQQFIVLVMMSMPLLLFSFVYTLSFLTRGVSGYPVEQMQRYFDNAFVGAFLHFALILGGAGFASSAFREEIDHQTLHHIHLQPIPRWLIPPAKLCGFLLLALPVHAAVVLLSQLLLLLPYGPARMMEYLDAPNITQMLCYVGVAALGLIIYCVIFLAFSMFFRSIAYVFFVFGWEAFFHLLPDFLKNFTLTYYFVEMLPWNSRQTDTTVAILSEGPGALQTVLVLTLTFAVCMAVSCHMATRKQCLYGGP